MKYDIIARSCGDEVIFTGETEKGKDWILRHWGSETFCTENLLNAATHVRKMNYDGLEVVLFCTANSRSYPLA